MAIYSMTAYARQAVQTAFGELVWELKSVNNRFLDISLRLPEELNEIENFIKEKLKMNIGRGKVFANLTYMPGRNSPFQLDVNEGQLRQLQLAAAKIESFLSFQTDLVQLLKWPGVLSIKKQDMEDLTQSIYSLLDQSISDFLATRQREGLHLQGFIEDKLSKIQEELTKIESELPRVEMALRDKLTKKIQDLLLEVESQRFEQELLFYLQKIDVAEEVQRLKAHIFETVRVLKLGGVVGRRLDFLVQEMHREANTLGNKVNDIKAQQSSLEIKVLIEQIREQVQNIE